MQALAFGLGTSSSLLPVGSAVPSATAAVVGEKNFSVPNRDGVELFKKRQFEAARRVFQEALRSDPNSTDARLFLAWIALEEKKTDEAIDWIEDLTRLNPTNSVGFLWLGRISGIKAKEAGFPGGVFYARKTKNAFEKAVALDPNNLDARADLVRFNRQAPAIVGGSRKSAGEQASEIHRRDPYRGAIVFGDLNKDEGKLREAEERYQSAAALNPKRLDAHYRLGMLYRESSEFDKAFAAFERILKLEPRESAPYETTIFEAYFEIGETAALSGQRLDRAVEALRIYLKSHPDQLMPSLASAHCCLGTIYEKKGDLPSSKAEYTSALALEPGHEEANLALKRLKLN